MGDLSLIDQANSELELYLRKVLKSTGVDLSALNAHNNDSRNSSAASPHSASNGVELRAQRLLVSEQRITVNLFLSCETLVGY